VPSVYARCTEAGKYDASGRFSLILPIGEYLLANATYGTGWWVFASLPTSLEGNEIHSDLVVGYGIGAGSVGVIASTILEFIVKHTGSYRCQVQHTLPGMR